MKNKKTFDARFEQLIAGALLKFGQIDMIGLTLLMDTIKSTGVSVDDSGIIELKPFVERINHILTFKKGISLDETMCGSITLRQKLENYQGRVVREYMDNLNVTNFVLRKLKEYSSIDISKRAEIFSQIELTVLDEALASGLVGKRWNDDIPSEDYEEYYVTQSGEIAIFKEDNVDLIVDFVIELESRCYNPNLLDDYLKTKDLSARPFDILNVESFEQFGSLYDRDILTEGASTLSFKPLHYEQGIGYDQESKDLVLGMFEILESDHCVYVCHPNHIFKAQPLIKGKSEIVRVEWDNIDAATMFAKNDYEAFLDANEAYKYTHRRLRHQIVPALQKGNNDIVGYLAVVERYRFDGVDNYIVRGLIRGDATSISFAYNPLYERTITKDVWTKGLRMGDNNTPELYLQRRNPIDYK